MKDPVLIIGINPRCGTNYLHRLLLKHTDCSDSNIDGEDFIMYYSKYLRKYIDETHEKNKIWGNSKEILVQEFSTAISRYLGGGADQVTVSKTPHPEGLNCFISLFDSFKIVILSRKCTDVAESFVKSFGGRYDDAIRGWNNGAKLISQIENKERCYFLKYEALVQDEEKELSLLLNWIGLSSKNYDFSEQSKVIGSSQLNKGAITWSEDFEKDAHFEPTKRSHHWNIFRKWRFEWLAGKYSRKIGYDAYFRYRYNPLFWMYNFLFGMIDLLVRSVRKIYSILSFLSEK